VPTKVELVGRIAERLGVPAPPVSNGASEPRRIFELVVEELGLAIELSDFNKPDLAHAICDAAEVDWSIVSCESHGGRVTKTGLIQVLRAVDELLGN
jgi:hypothetical protein